MNYWFKVDDVILEMIIVSETDCSFTFEFA
jgi:hypothetical protein